MNTSNETSNKFSELEAKLTAFEALRHYLMLTDIQERVDPTHKWSKLKSIGLVESVRTVDGKTTVVPRYYISSLPKDASLFGQSVRGHWGIENSLHWDGVLAGGVLHPPNLLCLMSHVNVDDCRIRKDNAPKILLSCSSARLIY